MDLDGDLSDPAIAGGLFILPAATCIITSLFAR
jgi:hypothetical protein